MNKNVLTLPALSPYRRVLPVIRKHATVTAAEVHRYGTLSVFCVGSVEAAEAVAAELDAGNVPYALCLTNNLLGTRPGFLLETPTH